MEVRPGTAMPAPNPAFLSRRAAAVGAALALAGCSVFGASLDGFTECQPGDSACTETCPGGNCTTECTDVQTLCDGACVDTQINQNHCGACGTACDAGTVCTAGECAVSCPGGQVECEGLCYDLINDTQNCGECGNACLAGEVCGNGQCALDCPLGQTDCSGSCKDLTTDSLNCGACGTACGANEECVDSDCAIACKTLLNQVIADPWGVSWDGLERAATDVAQAEAACAAINGRLPTASELYRVSATQSATVGQSIHTNPLWSLVPYGGASHATVRLSDAAVSTAGNTTTHNYRCVCPPPLPTVYVGNNCFGPTATPCFELEGEGDRYHMDTQDRAPLSKGGAIWECNFYRGRLARPIQYAEAIQQGIGAGSNEWLQTADDVRNDLTSLVSWSDPATWVFEYTGGKGALTWATPTDFRPFRCIGTNFDSGTHPGSVANEYVGPKSRFKGETVDDAVVAFVDAHDACWDRGGHVPFSGEIAQLVIDGLPGGTGAWQWSSDQVGYESGNGNFLIAIKRWTEVELGHQYAYSTDLTWSWRYDTRAFRCIYYPIDESYAGPAGSA